MQVGVAAYFELIARAEDVAEVLGRVGGVGGVDDQDDVGFAGVAFEDLFGSEHFAFAVQAALEVDRELRREVLVGFLDGEELVDDQVRLAAASVNFAFEEDHCFGLHFVAEAGVVLGPHDAADDACWVFEIEVDVFRMPVAAGLFRLGFLDAADHAGDEHFGAVLQIAELFVVVSRVLRELVGELRQRMTGEEEAEDFFLGRQLLRVCPIGSVRQISAGLRRRFVRSGFVVAAEERLLAAGFVLLT